MKKILRAALAALLVLSVVGCTTGKTNDGGEKKGLIGFSTITLGAEFFADLDAKVHARFEKEGYRVETVSCDANAAKQVTDIENLMTMECEAIFFFAMDAEAITDVCIKARAEGIKMYGIACHISNQEAYDAIINTDQRQSGVCQAELASDWINKTFPDAADGSIEVAVIGLTSTEDSNARTDGMLTITELNKKVKVVEMFDAVGGTDGNLKAQEYAEMMISKYPNLKVVLTYGTDLALGANEVFMKESGLNRDEFAIFCTDTNAVLYQRIGESRTNGSLIRATASLGDDLSLDVWDCFTGKSFQYMDAEKCIYSPPQKITTDNIDEYL